MQRVMDALREGVRRRREVELYDGTPVEERVARRLKELADEAQLDPELLHHILAEDGRWNLSPDYRVKTHRRGLSALLVRAMKSVAHPFVRLYTDPVVHRQAQINLYLLQVMEGVLDEATRLHQAVAALEERVQRLEGGPKGGAASS